MKKLGVIQFPGTNCDRDIFFFGQELGFKPEYLWHQNLFSTDEFEMIIIPGGFSFGDYLRTGALAARAKVMKSVTEFALKGGPVLGICNGFQILCEAGLLPGVLVKNQESILTNTNKLNTNQNSISNLNTNSNQNVNSSQNEMPEIVNKSFTDKWVSLNRVHSNSFFYSKQNNLNSQIRLPIAHGEGCYYLPQDQIQQLEDQQQVWFRYAKSENPNGSIHDIAGVMNKNHNVAGLMPHPERALFDWMGGTDGRGFLC